MVDAMAETTEIAWADATSLARANAPQLQPVGVDCLMAMLTKRHAIIYDGTHAGIAGKRHNVVGVEIPPPVVSAHLADKTVPHHHIVAPPLNRSRSTLTQSLRAFSVNVSVAFRAALGVQASGYAHPGPYLCASLCSSLRTWLAFACGAHRGAGRRRVGVALERGGATFRRNPDPHPSAREARPIPAVGTRLVAPKFWRWLPFLASGAAPQPIGQPTKIVVNGHVRHFGGGFESACFCLCHEGRL